MSTSKANDKSVVLSVRLPEEMLEQGKAVAEITNISFNELVRRATERLIQNKANDPAFAAKADAYVAQALEDVRIAFGGEIPPEILAVVGNTQSSTT